MLYQGSTVSLTSDLLSTDEASDIVSNIDRLQTRCQSIHVDILTVRSPEQQASFSEVNSLVLHLERSCALGESDVQDFQKVAKTYLNACISDTPSGGTVDYKFQAKILGCKLEDQKSIRHRLECLVQGRCHVNFMDQMMDDLQSKSVEDDKIDKHMNSTNLSSENTNLNEGSIHSE